MCTKSIIPCALLACVLACVEGASDGTEDHDHDDDVSETDDMTLAAADAVDWGSSIVDLVIHSSGQPAGAFLPEGCARAQRDGAELGYQLSGCIGPIGHVIDGAIRATFTEHEDEIGFDLASDDLSIDGREVEFILDGVYRAGASDGSVLYTSGQRLAGAPDALRASFEAQLGWTSGGACLTRTAIGQLAAGDLTWAAAVDGYERCAGACPSAGTLTVSDPSGASVLTFDGSSAATLHRQDGNLESVALDCGR
jgi:hypothetical protein